MVAFHNRCRCGGEKAGAVAFRTANAGADGAQIQI